MWTAKELLQPTSWAAFGAMLWWAFYFVSVIQIVLFCFNAIRAMVSGTRFLWNRELVVLAISIAIVICYHVFGRKKKEPIQLPETTRGK